MLDFTLSHQLFFHNFFIRGSVKCFFLPFSIAYMWCSISSPYGAPKSGQPYAPLLQYSGRIDNGHALLLELIQYLPEVLAGSKPSIASSLFIQEDLGRPIKAKIKEKRRFCVHQSYSQLVLLLVRKKPNKGIDFFRQAIGIDGSKESEEFLDFQIPPLLYFPRKW